MKDARVGIILFEKNRAQAKTAKTVIEETPNTFLLKGPYRDMESFYTFFGVETTSQIGRVEKIRDMAAVRASKIVPVVLTGLFVGASKKCLKPTGSSIALEAKRRKIPTVICRDKTECEPWINHLLFNLNVPTTKEKDWNAAIELLQSQIRQHVNQ